MRIKTSIHTRSSRLLLAATVAVGVVVVGGCTVANDAAGTIPLGEQIVTFAQDFLRHALAAFLL